MNDMPEIIIENIVFDNAKCEVELVFDPTDEALLVWISSKLSETHNSKKEWRDLTSYGQCDLPISDFATLRELADCIKNEPWLQIINKEKTPFDDKKIKQAALNRLYNAASDLGNFLAEKIKAGVFRDITDGDGWIKFWKLVIRVEDNYLKNYRLHEPFRALMKDLPNADSRFLIKEPEIETRRLMNGSTYSERPIEKYLITIRSDNAGISSQAEPAK